MMVDENLLLFDDYFDNIMNVVEFLKGKKTYIVAVCIGLVAIAQNLGWIDSSTSAVLYGLLGATGVVTMRAAISKS